VVVVVSTVVVVVDLELAFPLAALAAAAAFFLSPEEIAFTPSPLGLWTRPIVSIVTSGRFEHPDMSRVWVSRSNKLW